MFDMLGVEKRKLSFAPGTVIFGLFGLWIVNNLHLSFLIHKVRKFNLITLKYLFRYKSVMIPLLTSTKEKSEKLGMIVITILKKMII